MTVIIVIQYLINKNPTKLVLFLHKNITATVKDTFSIAGKMAKKLDFGGISRWRWLFLFTHGAISIDGRYVLSVSHIELKFHARSIATFVHTCKQDFAHWKGKSKNGSFGKRLDWATWRTNWCNFSVSYREV